MDDRTISSGQVYRWTLNCLIQARLLKNNSQRRLCVAAMVLGVVLRAAARKVSVNAACNDLSDGPSGHAVLTALDEDLPKTLPVLERRLNQALTCDLPRRMLHRSWRLAIDWHLSPYYGQPYRSRNEICHSKPKQGTKKFHAYASACIVSHGHRYTLAVTYVRRHESMVTVLKRLLATIREIGLKIKCVLLDRAFFNVAVVEWLQQEKLPFVMPVVVRGRAPKRGRPVTGLRWIKRQKAGCYPHTMKNKNREVTVSVYVGYRRHRNRKDRKQVHQKLLFAAWRVRGTPTELRELYRKRFGIETSYRQMRQAGIYTCTRNPHLRLLFVAAAQLLRNVWVWIHHTQLAEGSGDSITLHLELLRFKRMLDWINQQVVALYHDGSKPYVALPP